MDLSPFQVTGTNDPTKQVSVNQWNALLATIEAGAGGSVTPQQFGAVGDGVTDDSAAFLAAIAYLKSISQIPYVGWIARGAPRLFIPLGIYNLGTTTLDIDFTVIIEGEGTLVGYGSRLKWTGDCTGIRIQAYNTNGASGAVGSGTTGSYTVIKSLGLFGPYEDTTDFTGNTEGEFHGIHARSNYIIEDCHIEGFAGDGLHVLTSSGAGGAEEGNSNCSFVNRLAVKSVRNGAFIDGADGNAGTFIGIIGTYCRQHTVWDSSFLGNTHIGHHSANAGLVPGVPPCLVSYSGNRYFVRQGQATGASTNAPSGTPADNTWWLYNGAGGVSLGLNIPAWVSGTTYREGGSYKVDSANSYSNWIGFYVEGGEASPQFMSPAVNIIGGLVGGARNLVTSGQWLGSLGLMVGGTAVVGPRQLGWVAPTGASYRGTWDPSTVTLNTLAQVVKALIDDLGTSQAGHALLDS